MTEIHGTCVSLKGIGILLRGPEGSGKSDLALRLIDRGAKLVADDRTALSAKNGRLVASCPGPISGLLEVRGVGVVGVPAAEQAVLGLVVDMTEPEEIQRMPERRTCEYLGIEVPMLQLDPFAASAVAKLRIAVATLVRGVARESS